MPPRAEHGRPLLFTGELLDAYPRVWLPANFIQAQRDYFGAHTYKRSDVKGTFHIKWQKK